MCDPIGILFATFNIAGDEADWPPNKHSYDPAMEESTWHI